jgi:hypothetical protein
MDVEIQIGEIPNFLRKTVTSPLTCFRKLAITIGFDRVGLGV